MFLTTLRIHNFRNIAQAEFEFANTPQLIIGTNAQGKTSLLEAIFFLATATSHRTHLVRELIRQGSEAAFVEATVHKHDGPETISVGFDPSTRKFRVDGQLLKRSSDLYGYLKAVLFSPEDLIFLGGSPADRRRMLDIGLSQRQPQAIQLLLAYRQALRQRNALLKRLAFGDSRNSTSSQRDQMLNPWDRELAKLGGQLTAARCGYALELAHQAATYYARLTNSAETFTAEYRSSLGRHGWSRVSQLPGIEALTQTMLERLAEGQPRDLNQGATLVGPHRDDLLIKIAGRSAMRFASQGQRRSVVLAMKLAERDLLSGPDDPPLLLVDDVTHEMDQHRCKEFLSCLEAQGQVFLTFTEKAMARGSLADATAWSVKDGHFTAQKYST